MKPETSPYTTITVKRTLKNRLDEYSNGKMMPETLESMLMKAVLCDVVGMPTLIFLAAKRSQEGFFPATEDEALLSLVCEMALRQSQGERKQ